jgi:anti-anti-sigma factor
VSIPCSGGKFVRAAEILTISSSRALLRDHQAADSMVAPGMRLFLSPLQGIWIMEISLVSDDGNFVRLAASGRISYEFVTQEEDPMEAVLQNLPLSRKILLDLGGVGYVDSSGIGWFLNWHKRSEAAGGSFVIHSIQPIVHKTLMFLRMDLALSLAKNENEAIQIAEGKSS